jgi:hypothetical protein
MADRNPGGSDRASLRQAALLRWDSEGGASREGPRTGSTAEGAHLDREPPLSNAELAHLRVRVIALENLMIALLAEGPDRQVEIVREMAAYISPRPGFTHHPLTTHAAGHMIHLAERAAHFSCADIGERTATRRRMPDG